MAEGSGVAEARFGYLVLALVAVVAPLAAARADAPATPASPPESAAPLPGAEWNDPDSVNWTEPPAIQRGPVRERLLERRAERGGTAAARLRERLRAEPRPGTAAEHPALVDEPQADATRWPEPVALVARLDGLRAGPATIAAWASTTLGHIAAVLDTSGPADPAADATLLVLGEDVEAGMALADGLGEPALASDVRRGALAVARRVAVWRATTAACAAAPDTGGSGDLAATLLGDAGVAAATRLVVAIERFESQPAAEAAAEVRSAVDALGTAADAAAVRKAVEDHYLAPNIRVCVHRTLVARMLPAGTVTTGPVREVVLGHPVRGTQRLEQSTDVRFVPDPDEIRCELLVDGFVTSRTVAESGPVAVHSRGTAEFSVRKPVTVSPSGLALGRAVGTASNQSRLADVSTDYDSVPIMGSLLRSIARNQHADKQAEATVEVNDKLVVRACREVDARTEPQFRDAAERVRTRLWEPLTGLGLEPKAVALESTADTATARLRLAGSGQLAAHTPRPRSPADAALSVQVHESAINNACQGLGLAGRRLTVEDLVRTVCARLGVPPRIPDDLPTDVEVAFASAEPLRVECRDGLVTVRMTLDSIASGRRAWYDIVAQVSYRPVIAGAQVLLEREGPVRLSGEGQQGRMEIALRTIVGKIFPKERPVALVPAELVTDRRMAGFKAVQAVSTDGWFALALAPPAPAGGPAPPTAATPPPPARRVMRR